MGAVLSPVDRPLAQPPLRCRDGGPAAIPLSSLLLKEHRRPIKLNVPWLRLLARSRFLCGEGGNGAATCRGHQGCRGSGMRPGGHALILREPAWSRPTPARPKRRDLALEPSPSAWEEAAALVKRSVRRRQQPGGPVSPLPSPSHAALVAGAVTRPRRKPLSLLICVTDNGTAYRAHSGPLVQGQQGCGVRGSQDTAHTWPGQTDERAGAET